MDDQKRRANERVGRMLHGKWRLERLLGAGGMAAVYEATHRNGTRAAIKLLHPELSVHDDFRRRFLREGYVANAVEHDGAVKVLDDEVAEDGAVFLVMELLEGATLGERAESRGGRLPVREALEIVVSLLAVLGAAHAKGIVHRDIKPDNVFLTHEGKVKVLDFGVARLREASAADMTRSGMTMGTPAFMPPEQARGRTGEIDARTDLWAVGAMLFTLLTGRFVHRAETTNEVMLMAMTKRAAPVGSVAPTLPKAVCEVVDRALTFEREGRYSSASEMADAIRAVMKDLDPTLVVTAESVVVNVGDTTDPTKTTLLSDSEQREAARLKQSIGGTSATPAIALSMRPKRAPSIAGALIAAGVVGLGAWGLRGASKAPDGTAESGAAVIPGPDAMASLATTTLATTSATVAPPAIASATTSANAIASASTPAPVSSTKRRPRSTPTPAPAAAPTPAPTPTAPATTPNPSESTTMKISRDWPRSSVVLCALAGSVVALAPSVARAADSKVVAAEALFAEGRKLFKDGNYAAACPKFDESNRLDPAVGTEFNLADCEERIGHVASAWAHWRSVMQALASRPTDVRIPIAREHLSKLEPRLPTLAVRLADDAPNDATVVRDGVVIERGALGSALPVDPGESTIEVRAPHHAPRRFTVRLKEGERQNVAVTVGEVVADPEPRPTEMVVDRGRRILAGVVTGVGLVGLGVGTAFGLSAASQNSDAKSKCPSPSNCDPTANDEIGRAQKAGNVSTIAFVAGGALVATGVVLWLTAPRVAVVPAVDAKSAGVFVRGTF